MHEYMNTVRLYLYIMYAVVLSSLHPTIDERAPPVKGHNTP